MLSEMVAPKAKLDSGCVRSSHCYLRCASAATKEVLVARLQFDPGQLCPQRSTALHPTGCRSPRIMRRSAVDAGRRDAQGVPELVKLRAEGGG